MKKSTTVWLVILGVGGLIGYLLVKKAAGAVGTAVSTAATATGSFIASPFEAAYTAITGNAPIATVSQTTPTSYYMYDANGALEYNWDGTPMQTSSPPGTSGNPYPNPHHRVY